jgi:hypothetical protein
MDQQPDWKGFAQRRFATPDTGVSLIALAERYATDAADVVGTLLGAVRPGRSETESHLRAGLRHRVAPGRDGS